MPKQEKEKYTPNNSFMGMESKASKVVFFGRGKLGAEATEAAPSVEQNELAPATSIPAGGRLSLHDSLPPKTSLTPEANPSETSLVNPPPEAYQNTSLVSDNSLTLETSPSYLLWDALSEQSGHNKLPNIIIDQICRQLTPNEQAVYQQLFRLSYGFGKDLCKIGLPKLAERSNMSQTAVQSAIKGLKTKGLIFKEGADFGKGREQGSVYRLPLPTSLISDTSLPRNTSLPSGTSNKEKALKDSNKKGSELSLDIKNCADCHGTGFWYPAGIEQGVAKCPHSKLTGAT